MKKHSPVELRLPLEQMIPSQTYQSCNSCENMLRSAQIQKGHLSCPLSGVEVKHSCISGASKDQMSKVFRGSEPRHPPNLCWPRCLLIETVHLSFVIPQLVFSGKPLAAPGAVDLAA